VLSDPEKKSNYDRFGSADPHQQMSNPFGDFNFGFPFNMDNMFSDFFQQSSSSSSQQNTNEHITLTLSPKDYLQGTTHTIHYTKKMYCDKCNGEGGFNAVLCNACQGAGVRLNTVQNGIFIMHQTSPCNACIGKGKIFSEKCDRCENGLRHIDANYDLIVDANLPILTTLQVRNAGHQEHKNLPPGNLIISLGIDTSQNLEIDRNGTAYITQQITIGDWYNGATININRFDVEELPYSLADLKRSDDSITFKNKGFKNQNNYQGDCVVRFRVVR